MPNLLLSAKQEVFMAFLAIIKSDEIVLGLSFIL